jgi:hypothetical protein
MEPTPQNRANRSFIRSSLGTVGKGFVIAFIGIWLSIYIGFLVTTPGWPLIVAIWVFALSVLLLGIARAEQRRDRHARACITAFAKVEEAAKNVINAGSRSDRARNMVELRQAITDTGRIGASSPIWTLPDDSVATIDASIGAIQAQAEYERGQAEQQQRRTNVLMYVFGVFGVLGFVVGVIALVVT